MPTRGSQVHLVHTLSHGELREKNGQHFVLLPKAKCLQNCGEKTDSILSCFYTEKLPKTLHLLMSFCGALGPSSGPLSTEYGAAPLLSSAPPLDPFGIYTVWGIQRWRKNWLDFSSRDVQKSELAFGLPTSNTFV